MPDISLNLMFNILKKKSSQCLTERIKSEKVEKLVANLHDQKEYVIQIRNLKCALIHGLIL